VTHAIELEDVVGSWGDDDPARFIAIADHFLAHDDRPAAAAALDRAFGLAPDDAALARHRAAILDELAVVEHGLVWRYVPAGTFLMGSPGGDPDERPVHPRRLDAFWITDVPLSWASFASLAGWPAPPEYPDDDAELERFGITGFEYVQRCKIRLQYCETETERAVDWHAHAGMDVGVPVSRRSAAAARFADKPMVAASVPEAELIRARISTSELRYTLPSEAQWEKAARGGLVGKRYAWGDAPPTRERCDFDRMGDFRLIDPRTLPANGYGLHGMCGGVAELTADLYDALAYQRAAAGDLAPVTGGEEAERVLRGGSWADCAGAVTVTFRMSRRERRFGSPTIGMRLVRDTV
jgi:formylglycine-generating enzyme